MIVFNKKKCNLDYFKAVFQEQCFVEGCDFLHCVQCSKTPSKTTFRNMFTIWWGPYGQKVTQHIKKGLTKNERLDQMEQQNGW